MLTSQWRRSESTRWLLQTKRNFNLNREYRCILVTMLFLSSVRVDQTFFQKGIPFMYLTIKETADYLNVPESSVLELILSKKIRALHDGDQYLINKEQFNTHLKQVEKYKELVEEILNEPIPEDIDVKDED